jgi:hypothetical protein
MSRHIVPMTAGSAAGSHSADSNHACRIFPFPLKETLR